MRYESNINSKCVPDRTDFSNSGNQVKTMKGINKKGKTQGKQNENLGHIAPQNSF
jgi:hypothetical protein